MANKKKVSQDYFKLVNPIIILLTLAPIAFMVVTYVDHKLICPEYFGPLSQYAELFASKYKFHIKIGLLTVAAAHLAEALVAVYKCYTLRLSAVAMLAWTVQTVLLGVFSLYYLLWPSKPQQQQQQQQGKSSKKQQNKQQKAKSKKEK